jgi:phosphatidylinositol-3-phosphatase
MQRLLRLCTAAITLFVPTAVRYSPAVPHSPAVPYSKVMVVVEENRTYGQIVGARETPYLTAVARAYGSATRMRANYPVGCPSLAAYILMTSGSTGGICDDQGPRHHPLTGPNLFAQLDAAHRPWRNYAEGLPSPCARRNSADGVFLVRHTAVAYYTSEARACRTGQVGLGALPNDLSAGHLPAFSLVTPNACHDMHGAPRCSTGPIEAGDRWLAGWLPRILAGPDYRAGHLVVIVTWDEGSDSSNHIPTMVLSPTTRHLAAAGHYDHCSTLRTTEDLLRLPALGCARTAASFVTAFHLGA